METPKSRRLRSGRWSATGQVYLLTTTCVDRTRFFAEWEVARVVSRLHVEASAFPGASVLAWVLMPDHWHGLIELGDCGLADVMHRFKSLAGFAANSVMSRRGPIWQQGFHDHALRSEEELVHVARYIVSNPVRANLVRRAADYPFWDAIWVPCDRALKGAPTEQAPAATPVARA